MKPIPSHSRSDADRTAEAGQAELMLSTHQSANAGHNSRRSAGQTPTRAYPWLLLASTSIAALFALLYITKPMVIGGPAESTTLQRPTGSPPAHVPAGNPPQQHPEPSDLLPGSQLPGSPANPRQENQQAGTASQNPEAPLIPPAPLHSDYEETNLRIQHILTATSPDGQVSRIDVEVPVLYKSRNLRWSEQEVASARELLIKLMDYQDKSRQLRLEGLQLVEAWNELMSRSIPSKRLRADSPSLPDNQLDATKAGPVSANSGDHPEIHIKQP